MNNFEVYDPWQLGLRSEKHNEGLYLVNTGSMRGIITNEVFEKKYAKSFNVDLQQILTTIRQVTGMAICTGLPMDIDLLRIKRRFHFHRVSSPIHRIYLSMVKISCCSVYRNTCHIFVECNEKVSLKIRRRLIFISWSCTR